MNEFQSNNRYWLFLFRNYTKYHLENINGFKGILKKIYDLITVCVTIFNSIL